MNVIPLLGIGLEIRQDPEVAGLTSSWWSRSGRLTSMGIAVAKFAQIEPFLKEAKLPSPDANNALLGEPAPPQDKLVVSTAHVLVEDEKGNRALIQVWMVNFGQRNVVLAPCLD